MTLSPLFENPPAWTEDNNILRAQFDRLAKVVAAWSQRMASPIYVDSDEITPEERAIDNEEYEDPARITSDCRLGKLLARFQLSGLERDVLLLSLLPEYDIVYGELYSRTQMVSPGIRPCVATLMAILCPDWSSRAQFHACLLADSRLMRSGLLMLQQKEHATLSEAVVLADNALYLWLLGHDALTPELALFARWFKVPRLPDLTSGLTDKLLQCCLESEEAPVVTVLRGPNTQEQLTSIARAMGMRSKQVLSLDLTHLAEGLRVETVQKVLRLAIREVRLNDGCLAISSAERLVATYPLLWDWLAQMLSELNVPVMLLMPSTGTLPRLEGVSQIEVTMPLVASDATLRLWQRQLSDITTAPELDIAPLLLRFNPDRPSIPRLISEAQLYQRLRDEGYAHAPLDSDDLRHAFQLHTQQSYGKLAQRYTPLRSFDDVVIDDEARQHIDEMLAAVRQRETVLEQGFARKLAYGTGISALFYGDSGTGKTMVAEALAGELGVDLIKIDLSAVVNKYIGETEKNLARIFDIAGQDAGVLFFDEADALFGKRSEVKDAKDRNANIEVAYLLQRLENYPGLVILATNHRNHLDSAFSRRLTFMIRFPFPDVILRERMWRAIWPGAISLAENIDFHQLALRAEMTGASIRNAALLASWLAAEEGDSHIQLHHIERAIKRELAKIGRVLRF
ncbi:ATP-binding protein [Kosakonia sp. BYX6]|uniref:ATP-binding protein n=1 Tax=Kosakonia calanthes TaxID=3139408 RepID=A0ABZ3B7J5_9ENTR